MARYRLSHSADRDFFDIYIYGVQNFGLEQTEAYAAGMKARFQDIADTPHLYQAVDSIRPGYRRSVFGAHAIYYRQDNADVLIVRILRAQNLHTALTEDIN